MLAAFRRGSWVPGTVTPREYLLVVGALAVSALVTAADYATGDDNSRALSLIERTVPLVGWAVVFGVGGLLLCWGVLSRRHAAVWLGHSVLAVIYTVFLVGYTVGVMSSPWADGIRGTAFLLIPAVMHWGAWLRMRPLDGIGGPYDPSRRA